MRDRNSLKKHITSFIILALVGILLLLSTRSTKATFVEGGLKIHGLYGGVYTWDSIEDAWLSDDLPSIEKRTNGSAVGSNLRGHFTTGEYGPVKLFVDTKVTPFIYFVTDDGLIIFNTKNAEETQELFREVSGKLK